MSDGGPGRLTASDRLGDPARVAAFSDGVFAIIITILVLEIAVPPNLSEASFRQTLDELTPTLVAWVVSFLLTGMYWVVHRDLFCQIRVVTRDLVWLNLLFLLPACLIPFGASVLGEYPDEAAALHIYGLVLVAVTVMRVVMYWYVVRRPELLWDPEVIGRVRVGVAVAAALIPVYLLAMGLAGVSPTVSVAFFFSVPLLYFLLITVLRRRPTTAAQADDYS